MIPLAYNIEGEAFDVPPTAVGWRVKRLRQGRGAPELVYGSDGVPLVVALTADAEELRNIVVAPGKYRLDPIDENHRQYKEAEAAYVLVRASAPVASAVEPAANDNASNPNASIVIEAMRQNSELARAVVDRFPAMLEASAALLRAADGAGLPSRKPLKDLRGEHETEEGEEEDASVSAVAAPSMLQAMVGEAVSGLVTSLIKGEIKLSDVLGMFDLRRAAQKPPAPAAPGPTPPPPAAGAAQADASASTSPETSTSAESAKPGAGKPGPAGKPQPTASSATTHEGLPELSPKQKVHFFAVMAALTPEEATLARAAAAELSDADKHTWFEQLANMSVSEAVSRIRKLLGTGKEAA